MVVGTAAVTLEQIQHLKNVAFKIDLNELAVVWGTFIHDQAAVMESVKLSFDLYILYSLTVCLFVCLFYLNNI